MRGIRQTQIMSTDAHCSTTSLFEHTLIQQQLPPPALIIGGWQQHHQQHTMRHRISFDPNIQAKY